jgi:hypothetical protein
MMKKRFVIGSCLCVIVLALAGFTPALASKPLTPTMNTVPIEVTHCTGINQVRTVATVSSADAWQIEQCLIDLYNAQQQNDQATITHCIAVLNSKGIAISTQEQHLLSPQRIIQYLGKSVSHSALTNDLSNQACFFTAVGQGMLVGTFALRFIQAVVAAINNQTTAFAKFILLLVMLPLLMVVLLFNDLIPIRILMPEGALALRNGSVFSAGLQGVKRMAVNATQIGVNLSWFTGITINIPPLKNESKPFTFVSGFAAKVEGPFYG